MKKLLALSFILLASTVQAKDLAVDIGKVTSNSGDRCSAKVVKSLETGKKTIRFYCSDEHVINFVSLWMTEEQAQELIKILEESIQTMEAL